MKHQEQYHHPTPRDILALALMFGILGFGLACAVIPTVTLFIPYWSGLGLLPGVFVFLGCWLLCMADYPHKIVDKIFPQKVG